MAGGWGHWKLCSLTRRAWAICQHGGLSTVKLLTWQLRAPSARDPVTRWMVHHLLWPSLEKSLWRSQSFIIKEVLSPSGLKVRKTGLHLLGGMSKSVVGEDMRWDTLFGHSEEFSTHLVAYHHVQFYHSCGPGTRTQLGRVQSPHLWRACTKHYKNQWYKQGIPKRVTWMVLIIILQLDGKIPEVRDTGLYSFQMHHGT